MIAVRALMNPAAQAAQAELRLALRRAIRAVRVHIRRRVDLVQKSIEFLTVMHTRVGHVVLPDQLVLGIGIHVVLVAVEALAVLLGPARISGVGVTDKTTTADRIAGYALPRRDRPCAVWSRP